MTDLLVFLFFGTVAGWTACTLWTEFRLCHQRGMARVHRGTSWTPKVPEQRDAA